MERFLQYAASGLSAGSLYALIALGLVLIYRSTRVLNFAHGDLAALSTFVAFTLISREVPQLLSLAGGLSFGMVVAFLFYLIILVPAQRREATPLSQTILTLGLALVFEGLMAFLWGADPRPFPFPLSDTRVWDLGGVIVSELGLGTFGIGLLAALLLYILVQRTRVGLAMRAISENLIAAQTLGIPTKRLLALSWGLSACLGATAGVFFAPAFLLDPFFMVDPFLKGFAAAILGGLESLPGAILGGLLLGVAEALVGGYLTIAFKNTFAFLVIILVLLIRPEGLLGREFQERV